MGNTTYESLKASQNLPSPNGVVLELLRVTASEDATFDTIASIIEADPAMASKLIKLVNSPFAGTVRSIVSIRQAVTLLGLQTIKSLALGFSLVSEHKEGKCEGFDYESFWCESLARAVAGRRFALHVKKFPPEEVFACGLVSQMGRLALATVYPQAYNLVLQDVDRDDPMALLNQEQESLDIEHNELTANMMTTWFMPELFTTAVRAQDAPDTSNLEPDSRAHLLARILHLAGLNARVVVGRSVYRDELSTLTKFASKLSIPPVTFQEMFDSISQEWQEIGAIFEITTRQVPSIGEIYTLAIERQDTL